MAEDGSLHGDYEIVHVDGSFKVAFTVYQSGFSHWDDTRLELTYNINQILPYPCIGLAFPDSAYRQIRAEHEMSVAQRIK